MTGRGTVFTFSIERSGDVVSTVHMPTMLCSEATSNSARWDRARKRAVFSDGIDPGRLPAKQVHRRRRGGAGKLNDRAVKRR